MTKVLNSASRIVLLMIVTTLCAGLFLRLISADQFLVIAGAVIGYYFGKPVDTASEEFVK